MRANALTTPVLTVLTALLVGCGGYQLRGRVVESGFAQVTTVAEDDPRYAADYGDSAALGDGVAGASVVVVLDPTRPSRRTVASGSTDAQGRFAVPVDVAGPGLLMHDLQMTVRRKGFTGLAREIELPRGSRRLLVEMPVGRDNLGDTRSLRDQTLDDARPYLDR